MRELEGENLRERGDLSLAKTSLSFWFFPSHSRPAPNEIKHRTKGKEYYADFSNKSNQTNAKVKSEK